MSEKTTPNQIDRIVREVELTELVGLSRSTVYRLEKSGAFPHRRKLSSHSVGWLLSEIQEWQKSL
jgi:prophage regulatory protein